MSAKRQSKILLIVLPIIFIIILTTSYMAFKEYLFTSKEPEHDPNGPVNANATEEARTVLSYLKDMRGKGILTGQHNYVEAPRVWYDQVRIITGKAPALWGSDFAYGENIQQHRQEMIYEAINQWKRGSLVVLTWHQVRPDDPESKGWDSVQKSKYTDDEYDQLLTPGTELHRQWEERVDEIAGYLKQLKDAGVPVIWRPYHEMNADFFWWGGHDRYPELWRMMYERFTKVHQLDNLLWLWNPNGVNDWSEPYEKYYPGDEYVDILGVDLYENFDQIHYDTLLELAKTGDKPITIGECGKLPNLNSMSIFQPNYSWFMVWATFLHSDNTEDIIKNVYQSDYAITRDEMVQLGSNQFVDLSEEPSPLPLPDKEVIPVVDDFESYGSDSAKLGEKYFRNPSGNKLTLCLDTENKSQGNYGLKFEYANTNPDWAGVYCPVDLSWEGMEGISFWLKPDGSNRSMYFQVQENGREAWETKIILEGTEPREIKLYFKDFIHPDWYTGDGDGKLDLKNIREIGIYVNKEAGDPGNGVIYLDDIRVFIRVFK